MDNYQMMDEGVLSQRDAIYDGILGEFFFYDVQASREARTVPRCSQHNIFTPLLLEFMIKDEVTALGSQEVHCNLYSVICYDILISRSAHALDESHHLRVHSDPSDAEEGKGKCFEFKKDMLSIILRTL